MEISVFSVVVCISDMCLRTIRAKHFYVNSDTKVHPITLMSERSGLKGISASKDYDKMPLPLLPLSSNIAQSASAK